MVRQLTQKQLAVLARGRATRDANVLRRKGSASPASPRTAQPSAIDPATLTSGSADSWAQQLGLPDEGLAEPPAVAASTEPDSDASTDSDSDSGGEPGELPPAARRDRPRDIEPDAGSLAAIFESVAGTEADPHIQPSRTARRASRKRGKKARSGAAAKPAGTEPKPSASARALAAKEAEAETAAEGWYDTAAMLFVLAMRWLVGSELVPNDEQASAITEPLVRIFMRHVDPARQASADVTDMVAAGLAFAMYVDAIWPALQARRRERRFARAQRRNFAQPRQSAQQQPYYGAPGGPAPAASGTAGLPQDAAYGSRRGASAGPQPEQSRGLDVADVYAEIGVNALEEVA